MARRIVAALRAVRRSHALPVVGMAVAPPRGMVGVPAHAIYGVTLEIRSRGERLTEGGAKVVVHCGSGLLRRWIGPAIATPK
jgi:hypothetical protein